MAPDPRFLVSQTVSSIWVLQAIYTAVELGMLDALAARSLSVEDVARQIGAGSTATARLLRGLAVLGLVEHTPSGDVALTDAGRVLTRDAPGSLRSWTLFRLGPGLWRSWGRMPDVVRSGKCVGELEGHVDWMAAFEDDGAQARLLDDSMAALTQHSARKLVAACRLEGTRKVVDVGGGTGELMAAILAVHPEMTGAIFDLPRVRARAEARIAEEGLSDRCEFVAGSFFEALPEGAGAYILKSCLCDWDDERTRAILQVCRAAMSGESRLLVIEPFIPEPLLPSPTARAIIGSDLNMMVVTGGRERTEGEFRQLISDVGLRVVDVRGTGQLFSVIDVRKQ